MSRRTPTKPRKLLVATLGVASMTYVATTTLLPACGGSTRGSTFGSGADDSGQVDDSSVIDEYPVGNLVATPETGTTEDAPSDSLQIDDFPVANLAVMPDAGMSDEGTADVTSG